MAAPARSRSGSAASTLLFQTTRIAVVVLAVMLAAGPALAQALNDAAIQDLITRAKLGPSRIGVSVVDLQTGKPLVRIRDGEAFIPASNMKLLTSGAALAVLGPEFEFRTTLWRSGDRLIIEAAGDPAFADPTLLGNMGENVQSFVDRLAAAVASAWQDEGAPGGGGGWGGAGRITEVIVDDRVFDREYVHPRWPADQLGLWYCAQVGGLNFHANVIRLFATPSDQEGLAPRVRTEPGASWLAVENRARTAKQGESTTLDLARSGSSNSFILRGTIRASLYRPLEATLHESSLVFARLMADKLGAAGLGAPTWRLAEEDEDFSSQPRRALAVVRTPLSTVLERCNGDSHNLYAESLIKRIGHEVTRQPGSWANGAAVIRMQLRERAGPDAAAAVTISDGSGLSRDNLITPAVMTEWLGIMLGDSRLREAFLRSVPLAAVEGNMVRRFRGRELINEVRCKSGFISGVRCLSGCVIHPETGRAVAFCILVNDTPGNIPGARVREFHEDVVVLIDRWLAAQTRSGRSAGATGR